VISGRDWTQAMDAWRRERLRELSDAQLSGYVLKQDSPSCGMDGVRVDTKDGASQTARGLFAQALLDAMPDLPVEEEGRLHDARVRENFLERVLTHHRQSCLRNDL
jgi:uncharacterized protein YbbK (DUF523 family)